MSMTILSLKILSVALLTTLSISAISASSWIRDKNDGDELTSVDSSLVPVFVTFFTARLFLSKEYNKNRNQSAVMK